MSEAYSVLARFYDLSMEVDYDEWVGYLVALFHGHQHAPLRVIDLGCGTGNLTLPLAERGYQLTGVDLSPEMVSIAQEKAVEAGVEIRFFIGDLRNFSLSGHVFDTAISGCDVLNYLTRESDLRQAFQAVHNLLAPGGLWLFDLNSTQKLEEIYGDQSYADLHSDFGYFWDNSYDPKTGIVTMDLTFFVQTEGGLYERKTEQHRQKLWLPQQIQALARDTGFAVRGCYDFLTMDPHSENAERWQFVLQRKS